MSLSELLSVIANIALTLTFLVGLVFGVAQVKAVERDRKERLTLEALRSVQTREFAELLEFVGSKAFPKNREEMNALPIEQRIMVIQFAQQMESLGILVADNLINLELVDKTLGSFVTASWKKYNAFFSEFRPNDPYIGEYFQWLAEHVDERMKNSPREPFYTTGHPAL